ncbi:hypothetical protein [Nocardia brevicatena]|uniref:hypothetical protein n=1 Tax=Nocardia brevicatena TaxID=37327 RepID=UPI0003117D61|nr:hypothetical protein [Nocardia brevicatena]
MSTEDAVSDPKEPEGTEVSTETTESESDTVGSGAAESADAGTSAGAKAVETADEAEAAAVPAEGSPKVDVEKPPAGAAEKAGDATRSESPAAGAASDASGAAETDDPAKTDETVEAGDSDEKAGLDRSPTNESPEADKAAGVGKSVDLDKAAADKATDADTAGKSDGQAKAAAEKRSPLTRGRVLTVVAAVLLIAAMVAVGVLAFQATDRRQELNRRAAATKAACDFGHNFATYTGDQVDDYLTRLDQSATGEWKKLVAEIGPDLKARFAERQVSSSAGDVQCGYESGSDNKARVVLIIDQSFTTAESATPGEVKVAANVDMEKVGDRWMVANFDTPMVRQ